jgi:uncharacterized OsmC-like protein
MSLKTTAEAIARTRTVLQRRPQIGLHEDAPALARWTGGMQFVSSHPNGAQVVSDMPAEFGGTGSNVTPGWLFRAGLASCAATVIAIHAAEQGIELTGLEVQAHSRSDSRGVFGLTETDGSAVCAGPRDVSLQVRIAARGVSKDSLEALVRAGCRCSPVPNALQLATPLSLQIDASVE